MSICLLAIHLFYYGLTFLVIKLGFAGNGCNPSVNMDGRMVTVRRENRLAKPHSNVNYQNRPDLSLSLE